MKRNLFWAALTGGAATVAATVLYAVPSQAASEMVLTATSQTSAFAIPCSSCVLHSDPNGAHIGGTNYDAGTLTDAHGTVVGSYVAEEIGMTPFNEGDGRVQIIGTADIHGSQITFQGVEDPPLDGGVAAITGGTGRYAGARGQMVYSDESDTVTHVVVRLR